MKILAYNALDQHPEFYATVLSVVQTAKEVMGAHHHERLDRAMDLVLYGQVTPAVDGKTARVASQSRPGHAWEVNGKCDCEDAQHRAQDGYCMHRLAWCVYRRVSSALMEIPVPPAPVPPAPVPSPMPAPTVSPQIPAQFIQELHGKPFVTYAGLLAMAHEAGLESLKATFISVTETMVLAEATAMFRDGREFQECGDATPENVHCTIRPHFARMALTRAKARCLRDALNIGMCCVAELEDGKEVAHA